MSDDRFRPEWACKRYGDYEHDWLDCPDCLAGFKAATDRAIRAEADRYFGYDFDLEGGA